MADTVQIANKLTIAGMGLNKEVLQKLLADKEEGATVIIARMFGKTASYTTKANAKDPTREDVAFKGSFEGHNLLTGEVFNSGKAYLPNAAENLARAAIDGREEGDIVVFACEIAVRKQKSSPVGYVFGVSVPKAAAQDELAELREQLGGVPSAPALEAPKPAKKGKASAD
jgi:hypothetical protein